jgi:hypothetical protein
MSNKIGFNILSLHWDKNRTHILDEAGGVWNPQLRFPTDTFFRFRSVGAKWLRYGTGNENRTFTFAEAMTHGFTIKNFMNICTWMGSTPIINVTVFQPVNEAVNIIRYIRRMYAGTIYLLIGNEPWNGAKKINDVWEYGYTPEQYCEFYLQLKDALKDIPGILYGIPVVGKEIHWTVEKWNEGVLSLADQVDFCGTNYGNESVSEAKQYFDSLQNQIQKPILVTEWEHPRHKIIVNTPLIYNWTLGMLMLFESLDYVIGHCHWDSSCGEHWKLFELNGDPTIQWHAFEAYTRKGIL